MMKRLEKKDASTCCLDLTVLADDGQRSSSSTFHEPQQQRAPHHLPQRLIPEDRLRIDPSQTQQTVNIRQG